MLYFYDVENRQSNDNQEEMNLPFLGIALSVGKSAISVKWQSKTNQIFCR